MKTASSSSAGLVGSPAGIMCGCILRRGRDFPRTAGGRAGHLPLALPARVGAAGEQFLLILPGVLRPPAAPPHAQHGGAAVCLRGLVRRLPRSPPHPRALGGVLLLQARHPGHGHAGLMRRLHRRAKVRSRQPLPLHLADKVGEDVAEIVLLRQKRLHEGSLLTGGPALKAGRLTQSPLSKTLFT